MFPDVLGLTKGQMMEFFYKVWYELVNYPIEKDAVEVSCTLKEYDHEIYILTAKRTDRFKPFIKRALDKNGFVYDDIIIVRDHVDKYKRLDFDVYIDDHPEMSDFGMKYNKKVLLYNRPWNEYKKFNWPVIRVYNMKDVLGCILL